MNPEMPTEKSYIKYEDEVYALIENQDNKDLLGLEMVKNVENRIANIEVESDIKKIFFDVQKMIENKSLPFAGMRRSSDKRFGDSGAGNQKNIDGAIADVFQEALDNKMVNLGAGMTAKVFVSKRQHGFCYKVIATDKESVKNYKENNDIIEESERMIDLVGFEVDGVKSPVPYYCDANEKYHILIMEEVDGVSFDDLFCGRADLPENFDISDFFASLKKYIQKMHDEKSIHHFDIHEGNVMIDNKTGKPWVIDFGKSKIIHIGGSEDAIQVNDELRGVASQKTNDLLRLKELEVQMRNYMENLKITQRKNI